MAKILLVEDNEMNRDMLSRRLERRGHEVVVAVDGAEGLELARREAPALILMDMTLPVLDGWEASRQLKADQTTCAIPILALTVHPTNADRERALDHGPWCALAGAVATCWWCASEGAASRGHDPIEEAAAICRYLARVA